MAALSPWVARDRIPGTAFGDVAHVQAADDRAGDGGDDDGRKGVDREVAQHHFQREQRRFYPHGELTPHIVGFTDVDNRGLAGIEQSFDDVLRASAKPLQISVDLRIQHLLAEELAGAMAEFSGAQLIQGEPDGSARAGE